MRKVIDFAKVYETSEAAEVLRVSPRTIQQLCRMKRICAAKIGKRYLIAGWNLKRFLDDVCDLA
ncbi:MAG: helix-turn-helix domain-containing protein [Victivallaceae bacterium]|nr:helix-turn-helix domain-containing protein [Victivallaceae bacterium]